MKLKIFILFLFVSLFTSLSAQVEDCGNLSSSAAAQAFYPVSSNSESCDIQVKLYYHLYYDNNGNNGVPANRPAVMTALLNQYFAATGVTFFHNECEVRRVNDNTLDASNNECDFFFQSTSNIDGVDIHVKDDNNPFRGVAAGIPSNELYVSGTWTSFATPVSISQTLGHEMGHSLGLFHTHHGTCTETGGGCTGGGGDPTQSAANGDYVLDTPRDPNLGGGSGANVNASCVWNGSVLCPDGMGAFTPDTDNFMAYTRLTCRTNFTAGQIARICELHEPAIVHNSTFACCELINETPELLDNQISNDCPDLFVDLEDLFTGNIPNETELVWSQDDDPSNGIILLPNSIVTESGTYYGYFYNANSDCYSQHSKEIEVIIVECCEDPTVDYIILNENGNPQTDFCVGDDVFLNGCVSVDATKYFIGIWEYELGGFAAGEDNVGYSRTSPFWINAVPGCMMSLDDIWANFENYEFRAGHEYRVQFAVQNECSTEWIVKEDELFTMAFPTPDYTYVDENGIPKNVFCVGETVFLDGSESLDENKYFLSIWQYNIGGFAAGESQLGYSRLNPSWAQGEVGSLINLNEIWANFQGDYFEPGFEYRVQLAVKGACSNGWNVKEDELFIVICCEGPSVCDAEFTVSTEEDKEGNISFDFNGSHEIYFEHTWTVFQHPASGTGPYTQVASSNNPDFSFEGTLGGCYTVVHEVVTPCGSCCYSREICNDSEGSLKISSSSVDCDLLCALVTPGGLGCIINKENAAQLIWDEVPGATSYQVVMVFNDPDCCGGEGHTQGQVVNTEENFLTLGLVPSCFSWKVRAICHEEFGQFSGKVCFNSDCGIQIPKGDIQADIEHRGTEMNSTNLEVYPNPTSQIINYDITLEYGEAIQNIALIDMNGKLIENIDFEPTTDLSVQGTHVLQNDLLGIYFIRLQLNSKVVMKKIMIIR